MKKGVFPLYLTLLPPVPTLCYFHLISSIFKTTHNPRLSHYSQPAKLEPSPPPVKVWLQEKKNYAGKNVGGFAPRLHFRRGAWVGGSLWLAFLLLVWCARLANLVEAKYSAAQDQGSIRCKDTEPRSANSLLAALREFSVGRIRCQAMLYLCS